MTAPKQQTFFSLFVMILVTDCLASIAVASKDPIWSHLAFLWNGPLDDIVYLLAAIQALVFLLDPTGEHTNDERGTFSAERFVAAFTEGKGMERQFASLFMTGARSALVVLPAAMACTLIVAKIWSHPVSVGISIVSYRHLSMVFPVFLLLGGLLTFLRLNSASDFWKFTLFGWAGIFLMTAVDGRLANHLFHLFINLESMQAWEAALLWAAACAATALPQAQPEVAAS